MDAATDALVEESLLRNGTSLQGLLPALQRLDVLLERAVEGAYAAYGPASALDRFRGLHITPADVTQMLAREPGIPTLYAAHSDAPVTAPAVEAAPRMAWLARAFGLSPFDLDVILVALAPEIDLRYEQLYAYLQDDVSRKRPSVDLMLNLLCPSADAKLARRSHFAADAPLIRHRLLHVVPDPHQTQPLLLSHVLKLDEQIVDVLLGQSGLDRRLAPFCQLIAPTLDLDDLALRDAHETLPTLLAQARSAGDPLRLYFQGAQGVGKRRTAEAVAVRVGARLLVADLAQALASDPDFENTLKLIFREAWFQDAILYLDRVDALRGDVQCTDGSCPCQRLLETLADDNGVTILAGVQPWRATGVKPSGVITVSFPLPDFAQRRLAWQDHLTADGIVLDAASLDELAGRFRVSESQIAEAVAVASNRAAWREVGHAPANDGGPTLGDLFTAARAQCGHDLASLARKIEPLYTWTDIVLPDDAVAQLREMCQRVAQRYRVLDQWGFAAKLSQGKGVNALFAGPSGTGKTMAAEIIANELGLDLYKIDLAGVVSKYIGETEKNLDRIFTAAENANAILFFDEADALFGKRSEVRDSHDRYANIEISYLLQKMEQYDGIAILATNLRQNLDDAFVRRLAFTVHFPFPDVADRRRIWQRIWPAVTPLADDVDLNFLAQQFKLSGGNIKNIALAAAFLAASDGSTVGMTHLYQATRREYQKLGKTLSEAELYGARLETLNGRNGR